MITGELFEIWDVLEYILLIGYEHSVSTNLTVRTGTRVRVTNTQVVDTGLPIGRRICSLKLTQLFVF